MFGLSLKFRTAFFVKNLENSKLKLPQSESSYPKDSIGVTSYLYKTFQSLERLDVGYFIENFINTTRTYVRNTKNDTQHDCHDNIYAKHDILG